MHGPTKEDQIVNNLNQMTVVHQYRDNADLTATLPEIRRKVGKYVQGVHAYAKNEQDAALQATYMAEFANHAGTEVCQRFASHEVYAAECFRGMNEELHGYRQLAASEARVKGETQKVFRTAEEKLQNKDDTVASLGRELERKHSDYVFEEQRAMLLLVAIAKSEGNTKYLHKEGKKLHDEFTEYQSRARKE